MNLKSDSGTFKHLSEVDNYINSWEKHNKGWAINDFSVTPVFDMYGIIQKYFVNISYYSIDVC